MNKQTKHPSLFDQALAIAINEGKVESSKDADTFNSGIFGENYLLFTRQKKLLASIPLERLKRGSNTVKDGIGCLEVVEFAILLPWILFASFIVFTAISIPFFVDPAERENKILCSEKKPGDIVVREGGAEYICPEKSTN